VFAAIAFMVSLRMLVNRPGWRFADDLPGNPARAGVGLAIGFLSTLMGIGGGILNNTFMTLYGRPIHQAVATSAGVGVLIAVPATIGFVIAGWNTPNLPPLSLGYVNMVGVAIVIPISVLAAPFGVRIAHALSKRKLEFGFGVFLMFVAIKFAWTLI
jgi:uncharacterized protein